MNSWFARAAFGVTTALPIVALIVLAWAIRVDAPLPDDVDAILRFANDSADADGFGDRLALLVEPHVDHRITTTRALVALEVATLGRVDFRLLSTASVVALLALAALLPRLPGRPGRPGNRFEAFAMLPVVWLLVQPQAFDALVSATAAANVLVLPLATMVFVSLRRDTRSGLLAGAGFALAAQFTQGNGVLVLPAALVSLVLAGRRWDAWFWTGLSTLLAFVFFSGFAGQSGPAGLAPSEWGRTALYALAFVGSAGGFGSGEASVAVGSAVLVFLCIAASRAHARANPWLWGAIAFVLLSVAANAVGRAGNGIDYAAGQARYRVYSATLLALCHLIAFDLTRDRGRHRAYAIAGAVGAMAFGSMSYVVYAPRAEMLAAEMARGLARWSVTGDWLPHPNPARAGAELARSRALGTFEATRGGIGRWLDGAVERGVPSVSGPVDAHLSRDDTDTAFRVIEGYLLAPGLEARHLSVFLLLEGDGGSAIVSARTGVQVPGRRPRRSTTFRSILSRSALPADAKAIGLITADDSFESYAGFSL